MSSRERLRIGLVGIGRHLADAVFVLLLMVLALQAGWLGARHDRWWDWTGSARNSLSAETLGVLDDLGEGLRITVYAPGDHRISRAVEQLVMRYRRRRPDIVVEHIDPQRTPEAARADEVRLLGQLVLSYQGRHETLDRLSESTLTNAIARLMLERRPWVGVLEGHGERSITGSTGPDLGRLGQLLVQRGYRLLPLDLARQPSIPENLDLLVIGTPPIALFPGEADALVSYLENGGNLLWLMDPGPMNGLEPLASVLGIEPLPGQIVDAAASRLELDTPTIALVEDWPEHPLGEGMEGPSLFPGSIAFAGRAAPGWMLDTTLTTGPQSWNETGPVRGKINQDPSLGEQRGPLPLALVLTRPRAAPGARVPSTGPEQRVIVVGDGDFASNLHLGEGANRILGLRMVQWLSGRTGLVSVPEQTPDTAAFTLSPLRGTLIFAGSLIGLPALLLAIGLMIRWRRGREPEEVSP
jgi:ABC-type uncharacterized transport system involved in gliding motility auxiliary subunit